MVELASVQTSHKKLIRELETARYELASLWGETTTEFNLETPEISNINLDSEFYSDCKNRISEHPELKIASNKVAKAKAQSILAKAQATGNFEFAMGVQKSREDNKHNYFAGISIPLQIFDRNQGNISASKARVKEEENSIRQSELDLTTRLIELQKQLQSISEECENASATLLPGAKLAFSQMKKAYDQGERELFELFDAHRILLEARKVSARLEAEQLALYAEMCLITNQQALLLNVFGHEMTEIENER
jgi:cobalt-zinc-cadmium efflux system outer membrane protein